ncbi:LysR substrate-binding domain-containing protein [Nigerium massiliense]|uniref:LysR substrate-binding domain-containing protein n=1 Tax=Nigerium massiliense TaxID=1522317 RepID=UPI001C43DCBA|nr:LysR substrate-binding domain-containing protein [Nigerium massiliense]
MFLMEAMHWHHFRVELQQLRYAVAVAEERSFTRAAERCFVVQSALSHQIKALEGEIGVRLFARNSRRVELTPAGEAFVASARESLRAAERAVVDAAAAEGEVRGVLSLGMIPTVGAVDVPALLADFHAAHPAVRVRLRSGNSEEFLADIRAGALDVAFLGLPEGAPPDGVGLRELSRESLVAVLPAQHRLAGRTRLALADLADERFVDFPTGSSGRAQSDLAFSAAGLDRDVSFEVMSLPVIVDLIERGLAVGLLSASVLPADSSIVTAALTDGPRRVEYLAWDAFNPNPAAVAFLALVAKQSA